MTYQMETGSSARKRYVRILLDGPQSKEDYQFAKELIDGEYATGRYEQSKSRDSYGEVTKMLHFTKTMKGRLILDDFQVSLYKESWKGKLGKFGVWLTGFLSALLCVWFESWLR